MLTPAVLGTAGFLQELGSREGDFISPGVCDAVYATQTYPQPPCRALPLHGHTDPGRRCVPRALIACGCTEISPSLGGFVVELKKGLDWHLGLGWGSEMTHGSSLAEGWQRGWGTAAVAPRHKQSHTRES